MTWRWNVRIDAQGRGQIPIGHLKKRLLPSPANSGSASRGRRSSSRWGKSRASRRAGWRAAHDRLRGARRGPALSVPPRAALAAASEGSENPGAARRLDRRMEIRRHSRPVSQARRELAALVTGEEHHSAAWRRYALMIRLISARQEPQFVPASRACPIASTVTQPRARAQYPAPHGHRSHAGQALCFTAALGAASSSRAAARRAVAQLR